MPEEEQQDGGAVDSMLALISKKIGNKYTQEKEIVEVQAEMQKILSQARSCSDK